jgi:serine/threonine protein kinase
MDYTKRYKEDYIWLKDYPDESTKFLKIAKVGKGTYGYVYKAHPKENPGIFYALKKIKQDKERDDGFPITALREIQILQTLNHKNIIKLVTISTSKPAPQNKHRRSTYLVLDYMEHDFVSLLSRVTFNYCEIKCLMYQLLQGVDYLHTKNIIHRDMKTGNLLLNNKGKSSNLIFLTQKR